VHKKGEWGEEGRGRYGSIFATQHSLGMLRFSGEGGTVTYLVNVAILTTDFDHNI